MALAAVGHSQYWEGGGGGGPPPDLALEFRYQPWLRVLFIAILHNFYRSFVNA